MKQDKKGNTVQFQLKKIDSKKSKKRKPVDDKKIIIRDQTSEIISKAFNIAEFHYIHKKDQKKFENREIQQDTTFISKDETIFKGEINLNSKLTWNFISRIYNRILSIEQNGNLTISNFDNTDYYIISLNKFYEKDSLIISCELFENDTTPESKLLILYNNFNFCVVDLYYLNINKEKNEDPMISLENAKGTYFNFKPYLNTPFIDSFVPNFSNGMKILIFPQTLKTIDNTIILNFTQISSRIIVFDFLSNVIVGNYVFNLENSFSIDKEYVEKIKYVMRIFLGKSWSLKQYDYLKNLISQIEKKKDDLELYKYFTILILTNDEKLYKNGIFNKPSMIEDDIINRDEEYNKLYKNIVSIINYSLTNPNIVINAFLILKKMIDVLSKIFDISNNSNQQLSGKKKLYQYQRLFLYCYSRQINLEEAFKENDQNNTGLLPKDIIISILKNCPIGLTDNDLNDLLSDYFIFDDNNNYMYNYLLLLEELQIIQFYFMNSHNLIPNDKFQHGFFTKDTKSYKIKTSKVKKTKRKSSYDFKNLEDEIEEKNAFNEGQNVLMKRQKTIKNLKSNENDFEILIQIIINSCSNTEMIDIVYLSNMNIMFGISPIDKNITIFKLETGFSFLEKPLIKIGCIYLHPHYDISPRFLFYLSEKNLLITQRNSSNGTQLVVIDIFNDIFNTYKENKYYIDISRKNVIPDILIKKDETDIDPYIIYEFYHLKNNELFIIKSKDCIKILNPKTVQYELSYEIELENKTEKNPFDNILKNVCEYPSEKTGALPYKVLKEIVINIPIKHILTFSLGQKILGNSKQISVSDWMILINDNNIIDSYSINQLYLNRRVKSIDDFIPKEDFEKLRKYALTIMEKSYELYKLNYLPSINNYIEMTHQSYNELITQLSTKIKEVILYNNELSFNPFDYNIQTISTLVKIIKDMNLVYNYQKISEMIPKIILEYPTYDVESDFFKEEIFPDRIAKIGYLKKAPKRPHKKREILDLNTYTKIIDSAIKKFAKFCLIKKMKQDAVFKALDNNAESIIDKKQFFIGFKNLGLLGNNLCTEEELKELFRQIDNNNSECITFGEFNKFFDKNDLSSIKSKIKKETELREIDDNFDNFASIDSKFISAKFDAKIDLIKSMFEKIINFYRDLDKDVTFDDVKDIIYKIDQKVSISDINITFPSGIIFYEQFMNFICRNNDDVSEEEIKKLFFFFDQNNKNLFIYTKNLCRYLHESKIKKEKKNENKKQENEENEEEEDIETSEDEINRKYNLNEYLLIWLAIMKKLIKYCILKLEIVTNDFSDQFFLSTLINKKKKILNYISSQLASEKITKNHLGFIQLEMKVFDSYLDYNNFGIVFRDELRGKFDEIMKIIQQSDLFDYTKLDKVEDEEGQIFINKEKESMINSVKYFEEGYIKKNPQVYDLALAELIYFIQNKKGIKDLSILYSYFEQYDDNNDSFLTIEEMEESLRNLFPMSIFNNLYSKSFSNQFCQYFVYPNEQGTPFVSIDKIVLMIFLFLKKYDIFHPILSNIDFNLSDNKGIDDKFYECMDSLSVYDSVGNEIKSLSDDYLKLIKEGFFGGIIILNKDMMLDNILNSLKGDKRLINDYINIYMRLSNKNLVDRFNKRIKSIEDFQKTNMETTANTFGEKVDEIDYSKIDIPKITLNLKKMEFLNRKKFRCNLIETFDSFHPETNVPVNITKLRKSFLLREISNDGQNLLNHIEYSLKVNHYLQKKFNLNKDKNKEFPFLKNFGMYVREVIIDKKKEEEIYIINEKIDLNEYMCIDDLLKSNAGLLEIPELSHTDMAFYIVRFWSEKILSILTTLHNMNVTLRYFSLKDFYLSNDGKRIKMRNLFNYSFTNLKGEIYNGADLFKILLSLDYIESSDIDLISNEKIEEIYSDAYLAPEFILKESKKQTKKIDTWVFGICVFNLLFGHGPISFFCQLKNWVEKNTNYDFNSLIKKFPCNIISSHFFYNTFLNIEDIMKDKFYYIKVLKLKSFSAIVNEKHLNLATESQNSINGLGIILDMINACLSINPEKRPDLNSLIQCDLFTFNQYELILCNKFMNPVLNYYSPDLIIKTKMLYPLRKICTEILKVQDSNPLEINSYENFIFNTIMELNKFLFNNQYSKNVSQPNNKNKEEEKNNNNFVKNPEYYFNNSMLVKCVIENKIIELLIFLVLKHFNANLEVFKKQFKHQLNRITELSFSKDKAIFVREITSKKSNYNNEMKHYCGRLISGICDLLYNCIQAMTSYDHMLTLYVEDILICIIKLFSGEDNQLLGNICDYKEDEDKLKKYILFRTFLRDESVVLMKDFKEDELDKLYSVLYSNLELYEIKTYWCPELYFFTYDLFKEAFGDDCTGNKKYIVIKNYLEMMNAYSENIANQLENPLVNNKIGEYLTVFGNHHQMKLTYNFINTTYVNEILSLSNCFYKILYDYLDSNDPHKNLVNKRASLGYIHTIFKGKNEYKIRACLDFKVHFIIFQFLYTNLIDEAIKVEIFNILKEISVNLIDMTEISWMFGNNYNRIFVNIYKEKTDVFDMSETFDNNISNWDSNFSLISFMNKLLSQPHTFILYFTHKFLGINMQRSKHSYVIFMKEFGLIFSNPLCLKPLMKTVQKSSENVFTRQICLDILFNLLMSNNPKIISNFNMTICNFYEILMNIVRSCIQLPPHLRPKEEDNDDVLTKGNQQLKKKVCDIIKILIDLQNPYISTQMFSSPHMIKYMEQNNLSFTKRYEIDDIEREFISLKDCFDFTDKEDKIISLINTFKAWVFYLEKENENTSDNEKKIKNIIYVITHIFNIEWTQGKKKANKNCLIFNIVKLYEWLMKKEHIEFLFPKDDECTSMTMLQSLLNKIRDNSIDMKNITIKINNMNVAHHTENYQFGKNKIKFKNNNPTYSFRNVKQLREKEEQKTNNNKSNKNPLGDKYFTLQKVYNFITIKMMNIVLIVFGQNDDYYNNIFVKIQFGTIISELFKSQYQTLKVFLTMDNIETSVLDNYMAENRLRIDIFQNIMNLDQRYDDIKKQVLQNNFIYFMFTDLIYDMRKFRTDYKKLSLDFLTYKDQFPLRAEALSFINTIIQKFHNLNMRTETDLYIYDEMIKNAKLSNLISKEILVLQNYPKGSEIISSSSLFNVFLSNEDKEFIQLMDVENVHKYLKIAIQKDSHIKNLFPKIAIYIRNIERGIKTQ